MSAPCGAPCGGRALSPGCSHPASELLGEVPATHDPELE